MMGLYLFRPKIRHFLAKSENAVRIQIAVALIAFLLLRPAQTTQKVVLSPLAFARLVCTPSRRHKPRWTGSEIRCRLD